MLQVGSLHSAPHRVLCSLLHKGSWPITQHAHAAPATFGSSLLTGILSKPAELSQPDLPCMPRHTP